MAHEGVTLENATQKRSRLGTDPCGNGEFGGYGNLCWDETRLLKPSDHSFALKVGEWSTKINGTVVVSIFSFFPWPFSANEPLIVLALASYGTNVCQSSGSGNAECLPYFYANSCKNSAKLQGCQIGWSIFEFRHGEKFWVPAKILIYSVFIPIY